jgi:hypothetical protein
MDEVAHNVSLEACWDSVEVAFLPVPQIGGGWCRFLKEGMLVKRAVPRKLADCSIGKLTYR